MLRQWTHQVGNTMECLLFFTDRTTNYFRLSALLIFSQTFQAKVHMAFGHTFNGGRACYSTGSDIIKSDSIHNK